MASWVQWVSFLVLLLSVILAWISTVYSRSPGPLSGLKATKASPETNNFHRSKSNEVVLDLDSDWIYVFLLYAGFVCKNLSLLFLLRYTWDSKSDDGKDVKKIASALLVISVLCYFICANFKTSWASASGELEWQKDTSQKIISSQHVAGLNVFLDAVAITLLLIDAWQIRKIKEPSYPQVEKVTTF
ncbi:hypothetical protein PoB_003671900 [Plakobranchus ocellatus]|uniref:Uncharacterized protein n=1 Tax=Plakobranchus ocellatus TaxID=259542 RepID=A0AAV4AVS3_9GAST|nr:hypothetical protein PoB_003671900 [Plakobranchus ocellatus]